MQRSSIDNNPLSVRRGDLTTCHTLGADASCRNECECCLRTAVLFSIQQTVSNRVRPDGCPRLAAIPSVVIEYEGSVAKYFPSLPLREFPNYTSRLMFHFAANWLNRALTALRATADSDHRAKAGPPENIFWRKFPAYLARGRWFSRTDRFSAGRLAPLGLRILKTSGTGRKTPEIPGRSNWKLWPPFRAGWTRP